MPDDRGTSRRQSSRFVRSSTTSELSLALTASGRYHSTMLTQSIFHLSLPVPSLAVQRDFYVRVLGCRLCRVGDGFEDFEFLGHQLTFHERPVGLDLGYRTMHFGAVVPEDEFQRLSAAVSSEGVPFLVQPHEQGSGTPDARSKMVFADPSGYAIELKSYVDPSRVLARAAQYASS